jgi:hypothetical protein
MRKFLASYSNIITRDRIVKKYGTKGTLFEPTANHAEYGETEERPRADPGNNSMRDCSDTSTIRKNRRVS